MRASLEAFRNVTATLADDLDKAKASYAQFTDVSDRWKPVLEESARGAEDEKGSEANGVH
jgi:hypothetical protein